MTSRGKLSKPSRSSRKPKPRAGSRSAGRRVRQAALTEVKDDLSRFLRLAESEEIVITRHGKPAGVLIGFESEDDWLDYQLEHHPEFLRRVAEAREGSGVDAVSDSTTCRPNRRFNSRLERSGPTPAAPPECERDGGTVKQNGRTTRGQISTRAV